MTAGAELIERVRLVCGPKHVLTDPVTLSTYRSDGLRRGGPLPLAVALPGNAAEVAAVVRACLGNGVSWVVRGAGTSRDGAALPLSGGLLIVMTRMRRVLSIDLADDELTVEPGVPTSKLTRVVAPTHSLVLAHPGTVGGAAAAGLLGGNLVGIDVVQQDGALVSFSARSIGYDIPGAFVGSHGTCGIAVSLTLRAAPAR